MKKTMVEHKANTAQQQQYTRYVFFLSAVFLLGGLVGCRLEEYFPADPLVHSFFQVAAEGNCAPPSFLRATWIIFRWPIALFFLCYLPWSGLWISILFVFRGVSLGYSVAALTVGSQNDLSAILLLGPVSGLSVPILFLLAVNRMARMHPMAAKSGLKSPEPLLRSLHYGVCIAVLFLCVELECHVSPILLRGLAGTFTCICPWIQI